MITTTPVILCVCVYEWGCFVCFWGLGMVGWFLSVKGLRERGVVVYCVCNHTDNVSPAKQKATGAFKEREKRWELYLFSFLFFFQLIYCSVTVTVAVWQTLVVVNI